MKKKTIFLGAKLIGIMSIFSVLLAGCGNQNVDSSVKTKIAAVNDAQENLLKVEGVTYTYQTAALEEGELTQEEQMGFLEKQHLADGRRPVNRADHISYADAMDTKTVMAAGTAERNILQTEGEEKENGGQEMLAPEWDPEELFSKNFELNPEDYEKVEVSDNHKTTCYKFIWNEETKRKVLQKNPALMSGEIKEGATWCFIDREHVLTGVQSELTYLDKEGQARLVKIGNQINMYK